MIWCKAPLGVTLSVTTFRDELKPTIVSTSRLRCELLLIDAHVFDEIGELALAESDAGKNQSAEGIGAI